jgi:hypothetical protein
MQEQTTLHETKLVLFQNPNPIEFDRTTPPREQ